MPPKRRSVASSSTPGRAQAKKARISKLAKENDITTEEEAEIKEAFRLFAIRELAEDLEEFSSEKEGVIRTADVRRALVALGLPTTSQSELNSILSAVDPSRTGYVCYEPFLSVCALKLHSRTDDSISEEVSHAYQLFTHGTDGPILLSHLRRVAKELKEDVSEELLRDMVREANGGEGLHAGVNLEQFRDVMRRAGVF
ncbi:hypothetical protein LOZ12_003391 [Ophidiomyces ophidiicola]|uniref:Uncharacterized protein n=1 Tax=Ophidiomyces ophidiicola TaxID=1387563 RepID=A0ACB8UPG1_9EURO|nr:uncharacterized protein LOZ57_004480 [Ophidiomyces ophidiicola]KAI1907344.1 hypothetical protein LOZ64_005906 [Ophidiomyces ophidiicola]KAI1909760.1 hypothetical protein LOZ61_004822 [Ophidiomyces ophidiicola]KAI1924657.1 hypothetical protein LOZ60_004577 [Ophidiomyces ophidiicola]KAI1945181.1 hypothetical protein LOZ57_004480 [Ophidiomyces ophidiicola]KAI1946611.1 hypothetical protein LOZ62_003328 [Ophidiomyces ophidiicola]